MDDVCLMFKEMGFDSDVASSANSALYNKGRSKKAREVKYLEALWSAHNKHGRTPDISHIISRIGMTKKCKLQPEPGRVEVRTASSYVDLYVSLNLLPQLEGEVEDRAREIALVADEDDGLPALAPDVAVASIRIAVCERGLAKKEEVAKAFGRSSNIVSQAAKLIEERLKEKDNGTSTLEHTDGGDC